MKRILYTILISLLLVSCEDPISIEIPKDDEDRLVVEGVINDRTETQEIKLSLTNGFLDRQSTPKVSGATVQVIDDKGENFPFEESSTPGTYLSSNTFIGTVNTAYKLQIELTEGDRYESDFQELKPVPEIRRLIFNEIQSNNIEGIFVTVETIDSFNSDDFYRWRILKNGEVLGTLADVFLRSDRLFNGNRFDVDFDTFFFDPGDTCTVEQLSLTESAFDFFRLVQIQAGDIGESSSTAPTEVIGNIRNVNSEEEVLGFFYATSVTSDTRVVPEL